MCKHRHRLQLLQPALAKIDAHLKTGDVHASAKFVFWQVVLHPIQHLTICWSRQLHVKAMLHADLQNTCVQYLHMFFELANLDSAHSGLWIDSADLVI